MDNYSIAISIIFPFSLLLVNFCLVFFFSNYISLYWIRQYSYITSIIIFLIYLIVYKLYLIYYFNFSVNLFIFNWFSFLNISYSYILDGLSISFLLLTTFLFPFCYLISWTNISYKFNWYCLVLVLTEFLLLNFFLVSDLFIFFIFFEAILIPIFFLIGIWGSSFRKIYASYLLFFYTFISSLFFLSALVLISTTVGCTNFTYLQILLPQLELNAFKQFLCFLLFIPFAVKLPIVPFHTWLPEAHVEAPTSGSVLLAGILLKLGAYGILRFLIPFFSDTLVYFSPIIYTIAVYSMLHVSVIIMRQLDLKRIIAYSSIIHMNLALVGLITINFYSLIGSVYILISHGLVSSGLFICVGFLYERYHQRVILYYKGIITIMPIYGTLFFLFILANASLPGMSSFISELLTLYGIFEYNKALIILTFISLFLSSIINFIIFNKIMYGQLGWTNIRFYNDLSYREIFVLLCLLFFVLFLGLYPTPLLNLLQFNILNLLYL